MRLTRCSAWILPEAPSYKQALDIVETAGRTCTATNHLRTGKQEDSERFINARIEQGHYSILEHVSIPVMLVVDRKAMAELTRHRLSSYSVQSTRYCNFSKGRFEGVEYIFPEWEWPLSLIENPVEDGDPVIRREFDLWLATNQTNENCYLEYLQLYPNKLDRASTLLNEAICERMVVTKNIRGWMDIMLKRTGPEVYACARYAILKVKDLLAKNYPVFFDREIKPTGT